MWTNTIGETGGELGESVQQTADGGYIITGATSSYGAGAEDIWLVKTDANGDTVWTKTFGGNDYDGGYSVQQTNDGGYIVAGRIWSGNSRYDIWLSKTDNIGNTLWTKIFGGDNDDIANSVRQTSDDGYIITGVINTPGFGNDVWLAKTDTNGDTMWTKTIGGSEGDGGNSVRQTSDGGYVIAGYTRSRGGGMNDIWLIKTDANGDTLWTNTFGGGSNDNAFCIQQTVDDGYIISGVTDSFGAGGSDVWVVRTDASGGALWTETFGESGGDYGYSVLQASDGGYIIAGRLSSDVLLIKLDSDVSAIDETPHAVINSYELYQNYPNPFNPTTRIQYSIGSRKFISLKVYDLLGKEIETLVNEDEPAGEYAVEFDASNLASGIYFYQLEAGNFKQVRKMILMR